MTLYIKPLTRLQYNRGHVNFLNVHVYPHNRSGTEAKPKLHTNHVKLFRKVTLSTR